MCDDVGVGGKTIVDQYLDFGVSGPVPVEKLTRLLSVTVTS